MTTEKPIPPALVGLCEAVFEIRNLVRLRAVAFEHGTIPAAQPHPKDERQRMKNDGAERLVAR